MLGRWIVSFASPQVQLRLMGYLHKKSRDKKGDSLVHDVFQGEVQAHSSLAVSNQIETILHLMQVKLCPAHEESRITESKEKTVFLTLAHLSDFHEPTAGTANWANPRSCQTSRFSRTTWTSFRRPWLHGSVCGVSQEALARVGAAV